MAPADALGRLLTRGGLGMTTCWLSGGRIACSLADHGGIEQIHFHGDQPLGREGWFRAEFRSAYPRVFRPQLLVGDRVYTLGVGDGRLHASAWIGRVELPDEALTLEVALVCGNAVLIQAVRALRNPRRHRLGLRLMLRDGMRLTPEGRTWTPWRVARGEVGCAARDAEGGSSATTRLSVVGDGPVAMRAWRSGLRAFTALRRSLDGTALALAFSGQGARTARRELAGGVGASAWRLVAALDAHDRAAPRPVGLPPIATSFAQQAGALLRGAMPTDLPGALRANFGGYWVWGWDTLVHAHAMLLAGVDGSVRDVLDLFGRHAHPRHGIGHAFDRRMRIVLPQPLPAQGLFVVAAWQQWAVAGDVASARRHWPLLTRWLEHCLAGVARAGLRAGMAMFPDHPQDAGQDGDDLSAFNNGIFYQACRCLEQLAAALHDAATAASAARAADACRAGFRRVLWDRRRGWWRDSVAASTLRPRPSYPSHAVMWVTPFARELVVDAVAAADFAERHHRCAGGLRMYPRWDRAFNADGNQLGQHYPPGQDPLYVRLMAMTGRQHRLREWLGWIETAWRGGTVPEGCTLEADNDGLHRPDNPGGRQMFSVKAWYDGLVGAILGITGDATGLTVEPGLDGALAWHALPLRGRRWTIAVRGSGPHVASVSIGGASWRGTARVPWPARGAPMITVRRTRAAPRAPQLRSADGAELLACAVRGVATRVSLRSDARVLARFWSPRRPRLTLDGAPLAVEWDPRLGIAGAWLPPSPRGAELLARCA